MHSLSLSGLRSSGLLLTLIFNFGSGNNALLLVGGGDDVSGNTELLNEEGNASVGEGVVGPVPGEDLLDETTALKRFDDHLNLKVGHLGEVLVLGEVGVLSDGDDTLSEQVGENSLLFLFRHNDHLV